MRRYTAFTVVGIAALGLALVGGWLTLPGTFARSGKGPVGAPGLEMMFSGGWLMVVHEPGGDAEVCLGLGAGGLLVINDTTRLDENFNCTGVGSWMPIGPREITSSLLVFVRDTNGKLVFYEKGNMRMTLSDDGNRLEGPGVIYIYWPDQDPLDPAEEPAFTIDVPVDAQRIPAE